MKKGTVVREVAEHFATIRKRGNGYIAERQQGAPEAYPSVDELLVSFKPAFEESQRCGGNWSKEIDLIKDIERNATPKERWMLSRDGKMKGAITIDNVGVCRMEGCCGHRIHVLWPDGSFTNPCSKGCVCVDKETLQII